MKRTLVTVAAVAAALVILNIFCAWYYNPTGYLSSPDGATDLIREPEKFTSRAKEGIAWAAMDENGYNNARIPGDDGVHVLMMGSSHTEGLNVMQHETASSCLDEILSGSGKGMVYNIGMSSHTLPRNAANMGRALDAFGPVDYVVLETAHEVMYPAQIYGAMDDAMEKLDHASGNIPGVIADRPLLKTLYRQFMSLAGVEDENREAPAAMETDDDDVALYRQALTELFVRLSDTAAQKGAQVIIYFHPHLSLYPDGSAHPAVNEKCLAALAGACSDAGITFIDMTDTFLEEYEARRILPHGFSNTAAGVGHLNRDGHRMIAGEIAKVIMEKEGME